MFVTSYFFVPMMQFDFFSFVRQVMFEPVNASVVMNAMCKIYSYLWYADIIVLRKVFQITHLHRIL